MAVGVAGTEVVGSCDMVAVGATIVVGIVVSALGTA
jgi:hypothetical protein